MSDTKPHIEISTRQLAEWLEGQPGTWWYVDGDPLLMSEVDFPCPNDELAEALRKHDGKIHIFPIRQRSLKVSGDSRSVGLDELVDTRNRRRKKTLLAAWSGSDIEWLLSEDKIMPEEERRAAMESKDAKAPH